MSSRVCATGHIKDPVPLKKSRALCPSGRFPPSSIHHVIIITELNTLCDCIHVLGLKMARAANRA